MGIRREHNAIVISIESMKARGDAGMIAELMPSLSNACRRNSEANVLGRRAPGACSGSCYWSPMLARFELCLVTQQSSFDRSFTTKHHSPFLPDYHSIVLSSISPKMAGNPVPFADIAKPANDVSPESFCLLFPFETGKLTLRQLLTKDFYHVQAGISSCIRPVYRSI